MLSMFVLLAKVVLYITAIFPPFLSAIVHAIFVIFYAVSISQQAAADNSDPIHPSPVPWYLTHGCGDPVSPGLQSPCKQAKAAFAVTCIMTYAHTPLTSTPSPYQNLANFPPQACYSSHTPSLPSSLLSPLKRNAPS